MKTALISEPHAWDSPIQVGAHHYARELLRRGWRVVFVSQPLNPYRALLPRGLAGAQRAREIWRAGGEVLEGGRLITYVPLTLVPVGRPLPSVLLRRIGTLMLPRLRHVLARHGIRRVELLWLNGAIDGYMLDEVPHERSFLRVADDYAGYSEYRAHLLPLLHRAVRGVCVAASASEPVRRRLQQLRPDVHVVRNGVVFDHFARSPVVEPEDLRAIPRPRAIYVGALAYWFDWHLLGAVAERMPGVQFVVIGPERAGCAPPAELPSNIHRLGVRPYSDLPDYLQSCDVGIVPFQRTRLVDGVSPIKVYEYLAAGLPVVATRWSELEVCGAPARLAATPAEFVDRLREALECPAETNDAGRRFAARNTWQARMDEILELCFGAERRGDSA